MLNSRPIYGQSRGADHERHGTALILQRVARAAIPRPIRNWLRRPGQSLAWATDDLAHRVGRDRAVEIRPGWTVRCHPAAWRLAYRAQVEDPDQVAELNGFIRACVPGMALLDVGAHFGVFSLAALHFGGDAARAAAVDPAPSAVRMLQLQARLNGAGERLLVVAAAIGARDGSLELVDAGVGSARYYVQPERQHSARERTTVPGITVDSLCAREHLRPTHVKIDVEGFEADVLRGATRTLRAEPRPLWFIELHNGIVRRSGADPAATFEILHAAGYELLAADGRSLMPDELLARSLIRVIARPRLNPAGAGRP